MKKFMTKAEREKCSNRLVLNFGILLGGALIMLYVYNFVNAGYVRQAQNVVGVLAIICAILAIVMFVVGLKKSSKLKNYSAVALGAAISGAIVYAPRFGFIRTALPALTAKTAVISVFVLMLAYFIVMTVVTVIILATHPEEPVEKKKIQHAKKKRRK